MGMSIDRFEEERVVLIDDNGERLVKPRELFGADVKEGDRVVIKDGLYVADPVSTEHLRAEVNALLDKLIRENNRK